MDLLPNLNSSEEKQEENTESKDSSLHTEDTETTEETTVEETESEEVESEDNNEVSEEESSEEENQESESEETESEEGEPEGESTTEESEDEEEIEFSDEERLEFLQSEVLDDELRSKYSSLEDIRKKLAQDEPEPVDERLKPILDFMEETGGSLEDYYNVAVQDFDNMSNEELLLKGLKEEYPEFTDEELQEELEDIKDQGERAVKKNALRYKRQFKENQGKYKTDLKESFAKSKEGESTEGSNEQEQQRQQFIKQAKDTVSNVDTLEFENGFEFDLSDDYKGTLSSLAESGDFLSDLVNENSEIDMNSLVSMKAVYDNIDQIVKAAISHGENNSKKQIIKDKKNPEFKKENKAPKKSEESPVSQITKQLGF